MFENLTLVTVIVMSLWLIVLGVYLVSARRNRGIEQEIDAVGTLLDQHKEAEDA
jgi:hypothetical protein